MLKCHLSGMGNWTHPTCVVDVWDHLHILEERITLHLDLF